MKNDVIIKVYKGKLRILSGQVTPLQEIIGWAGGITGLWQPSVHSDVAF
jgi:hypothetical protein